MSRFFRASAAAFLLLMATSALAQPIKLQYKFTPGEIDKYKMAVTVTLAMPQMQGKSTPPMNFAMTMTSTQKTLGVLPDGSAKIRMSLSEPKISGIQMPPNATKSMKLAGQYIVMRMARNGQTLSVDGLGKAMTASGLQNFDFSKLLSCTSGTALFPDEPVEAGQSWTQNVPLPLGDSQMDVVTEYVADRQVRNQRVAVLRQTISGSIDFGDIMRAIFAGMKPAGKPTANVPAMTGGLDLQGQVVDNFGTATGKLLNSEGQIQAQMTLGMPPEATNQGAPRSISFAVDVRIALTRIK